MVAYAFEDFVDAALHVEVAFVDVIVFAFEDFLEAADRLGTGTYLPSRPVKTSATANGWERKRWILRARKTVSLSSGESSSIPRIAMMSCKSL